MSWKDRLRKDIVLSSPDGDVFRALWIGNDRSLDKKLGIFSYPKIKGSFVQDLEVNADKYPITIYFEGENHDLESQRFFESCKQRGLWQIVHPVLGSLVLQLVSASQSIAPVEDANITQMSLEFIESIEAELTQSSTELAGDTRAAIDTLNAKSSKSFGDKVKSAVAKGKAAITKVANKISGVIQKIMGPIVAAVSTAQSIMDQTRAAINATLDNPTFSPSAFAGQVKTLIQTPAKAIKEVRERTTAYREVAREIFNIRNESVREDGLNTAIVKELYLTSIIGALGEVAVTSSFTTRAQAISAAEEILSIYNDIIDDLDSHQSDFDSLTVDKQYFSQSDVYPDTLKVISLAMRYILSSISSLKIEKRIVLKEPTPPIIVAMREYGGPGIDDENIDFFIHTNNLKGNEILLLPAGKEVVVYV